MAQRASSPVVDLEGVHQAIAAAVKTAERLVVSISRGHLSVSWTRSEIVADANRLRRALAMAHDLIKPRSLRPATARFPTPVPSLAAGDSVPFYEYCLRLGLALDVDGNCITPESLLPFAKLHQSPVDFDGIAGLSHHEIGIQYASRVLAGFGVFLNRVAVECNDSEAVELIHNLPVDLSAASDASWKRIAVLWPAAQERFLARYGDSQARSLLTNLRSERCRVAVGDSMAGPTGQPAQGESSNAANTATDSTPPGAMTTPAEGNGGAVAAPKQSASSNPPKGKRGRKRLARKETEHRNDVLTDWERARNAGTPMKTFCREYAPPLSVKTLERFVAWQAARNRRKG